jgi:hypothetical protein
MRCKSALLTRISGYCCHMRNGINRHDGLMSESVTVHTTSNISTESTNHVKRQRRNVREISTVKQNVSKEELTAQFVEFR